MTEFLSEFAVKTIAEIAAIVATALTAWIISRRVKMNIILSVWKLQRNRVRHVYMNRREYPSPAKRSVADYIMATTHSFTYVGLYFSVATDQSRVDHSLADVIGRGCSVTAVLLDPSAPASTFAYLERYLALGPNTLQGRVEHALNYFLSLRANLVPAQQRLLEIRLHKMPLTMSAFVMDEREAHCTLLLDTKWYGVGRANSFGIEFSGLANDETLFAHALQSISNIVRDSKIVPLPRDQTNGLRAVPRHTL